MIKVVKRFKNQYMMVMTCVVVEGNNDKNRRVLIIKRSPNESEGPSLWTIPGGRIEPTDWKRLKMPGVKRNYFVGGFKKACRREIKEETGLEANKFHILAEQEIMFIRSSGQPTIVLAFWTQRSKWPRASLNKKSGSYRWIRASELDNYQFIGDVKTCIRAALKAVSTGS